MNPKLILCLALVLSGVWFDINSSAAIIYPKEPDGGRQMVIQYISQFDPKDDPAFKEMCITNDLNFAKPFVNYSPGDLTRGKLLDGAKAEPYWIYIIVHGTNVGGSASVEADEKTGKALKCNSLCNGDIFKEAYKALQLAEQLPQVQKQDYEPRLLSESWTSFNAVWLHGQSNDFIIPLPYGFDNRINAYQLYTESQIIKILAPEARRDAKEQAKLDKEWQQNNDAYAKAMTDYEKVHGGKCGSISLYSFGGPFDQMIEPNIEFITLQGMSSECGKVSYKAKIIYSGHFDIVKKVEILEKLEQ
jgi:hypothetical protein